MSELKAVIQAGGRGTRLAPYSTVLPKALMPVGEGTVIDHLLNGFRDAGVVEVIVTVSKFGPLIRSYCGDGSRWNLNIDYLTEDVPLGHDRRTEPAAGAAAGAVLRGQLRHLHRPRAQGPAGHPQQRVGRGHRGRHPADGQHRLRGHRPHRWPHDRLPGEAQPGVLGEHRDLLHEPRGLRVHPARPGRSASTISCAPCWSAARRSVSTSTWAAGSTSDGSRTSARPRNRPRTRSPRTRSSEVPMQALPMIELGAPVLGDAEKQALIAVLDDRWLTMGERVRAFERAFADLHGVDDAVAVSSATAALQLILAAFDIGRGRRGPRAVHELRGHGGGRRARGRHAGVRRHRGGGPPAHVARRGPPRGHPAHPGDHGHALRRVRGRPRGLAALRRRTRAPVVRGRGARGRSDRRDGHRAATPPRSASSPTRT